MGTKLKGKMIFVLMIFLLIFCFSAIATAYSLPGDLTPEQIKRVDFGRADTSYIPLFPDLENDKEKIGKLLEAYNRAVKSVGAEGPIDFGDAMTFFMNSVSFTLSDGNIISMYLYNNGVYFISAYQDDGPHGYKFMDETAAKTFFDLALSYFVPAQGVTINSRELRLGEEVKITSDCAYGEAKIFLMPSPRQTSAAYYPYPTADAILIAQFPVEHDSFTYTFTLKEEIGKKVDDYTGKISPGTWEVVVVGGSMTSYIYVKVLPKEIPAPLAVAYDRGRVIVWNEKGIIGDYSIPAQEQPLLINNSKFYEQTMTYLTFDFLHKYLQVQVSGSGEGKYLIGPSELGLNLETNRLYAKMNGTTPYLTGYLGNFSGRLRLPWEEIGGYFAYKTKWLGPEQVVFLRNLDSIPEAIKVKMGQYQASGGKGSRIKIVIDGKGVIYTGQRPCQDTLSKKILVPLRDTVKALGGNVTWYPLHHPEDPNEDSYYDRWADTGIASYTQISLGNRVWGIYQPFLPGNNGATQVSISQLALALGYDIKWDSKDMQVTLTKSSQQ